MQWSGLDTGLPLGPTLPARRARMNRSQPRWESATGLWLDLHVGMGRNRLGLGVHSMRIHRGRSRSRPPDDAEGVLDRALDWRIRGDNMYTGDYIM